MTLFEMWNDPKFHMEKSLVLKRTSFLPVVVYVVALPHRVHSVPVWQRGGEVAGWRWGFPALASA